MAKGVALLDATVPDWADRVKVGELRMNDSCRCVLGYVFGEDARAQRGDYNDGFEFGEEALTNGDDGDDWAYQHGFDRSNFGPDEYPALAREWKRVIAERRAT